MHCTTGPGPGVRDLHGQHVAWTVAQATGAGRERRSNTPDQPHWR